MIADLFQNPDNLNILGLLALISAGALLVLGLTGRVVIYNDGGDLALNFGIVLIPLVAILYIAALAPPDEAGQTARNAYYAQIWVSISMIGSLIGAAACALKTAYVSIRENGPLLGIPVAALKISTAILALFLIAFWFVSKDKKQKRGLLSNLLFLGALGWFMSLLVNGDRVRARR
jgi:hypothetical protein